MMAGQLALGPHLILTFQRFRYPPTGLVERPPASLGALPIGRSASGAWLLPLADGECFWIGMSESRAVAPSMLAVMAELGDATRLDAVSGQPWDERSHGELALPGALWLAGMRKEGIQPVVWKVFGQKHSAPAAASCVSLTFRLRSCDAGEDDITTRIDIVDYVNFTHATGVAAPLPMDDAAAYQGWRLP